MYEIKEILKSSGILYRVLRIIGRNHVQIKGKNNKIVVGKNSILKDCVFQIFGSDNQIIIGNHTNLSGAHLMIRGNHLHIVIGDETAIVASRAQPTMINAVGASVEIGKQCGLSNSIEIHTSDYHDILDMEGKKVNFDQKVILEDHIWVGLRCILLKGTHIASNCIVGANSLLNQVYTESNTLLAGSPGKVVKTGVIWKH